MCRKVAQFTPQIHARKNKAARSHFLHRVRQIAIGAAALAPFLQKGKQGGRILCGHIVQHNFQQFLCLHVYSL